MSAPEVGLDELAAALDAGVPVIDVRNPDEYAAERIPGVTLIPLPELESRVDEVPKGEKVFIVCAGGVRSLAAAKALNAAGFDTVSVMGGTKAWVAEGRPFDSGPVD